MRSASARLPGHPDHACDLVAEAIVDEYVRRDPATRIQVGVVGGRGVMFVSGDVASTADFDVSALVKRTLGSLGVTDDIEPFVSIEPVDAALVASFRQHAHAPLTAVGYATSETPEGMPSVVVDARRVAKALDAKRTGDPEWFWLGPDAEVTAFGDGRRIDRVVVTLEHGAEPLTSVRRRIEEEVRSIAEDATVLVNPTGACERRGLASRSGASGRAVPYGSLIPPAPSTVGRDPLSAEKAGAWLCRAAARSLLVDGIRAVQVRATYLPGDVKPSHVVARDEKGNDLTSRLAPGVLSLDRVMAEWWRPGLNVDAHRWGFAGEAGMPWEEGR
ncbi:MAG: S-adenosylmethionine synthetase N-terminal domain-containing protein [Patescibacteria group bacterium]